jgi:hypothetical protein
MPVEYYRIRSLQMLIPQPSGGFRKQKYIKVPFK